MTESEKAMLHVSVLQALKAAGAVGRPEERLHTDARMAGFDLSLPEFQSELRAVADKNWVAAFSPMGVKRYRITELGKSVLVEAGL